MANPAPAEFPTFSPAERAGLRDFWEVYQANFEAIQSAAGARLAGRASLAPFVGASPRAEAEKRGLVTRERLRRALVDLELEGYATELRATGRRLASEGVDLASWIDLIGAPRTAAVPFLIKAYGQSPERLEACIGALNKWTEIAFGLVCDEFIAAKESLIAKQSAAIVELSTPVIEIRQKRLIVPIIGIVDSHRAAIITESILAAVRAKKAEVLILDITAVAAMDTQVASYITQTVAAARLMGVETIITGISMEVSRALVGLGIDFGDVQTVANLLTGLEAADEMQEMIYVSARELDALRAAAEKAKAPIETSGAPEG